MSAHTAGPWLVEEFAADEVSLITATGLVVAQVIHGFDEAGEPDEETRANARLVGASPNLLAALKYISMHRDVVPPGLLDVADKAIAQVEGP